MRTAVINRDTKETKISIELNIDGSGNVEVSTGIGFFDHMITAFAVHAGFDLKLKTVGDLNVDNHHTVEDTGIVLGQAISKALGTKDGIERFGTAFIPMDETLAYASLDFSNRPFLVFNAKFTLEKIGDLEADVVEEFFRAFAFNAGITLHINLVYGGNDHHICEALFKSTAHAIKLAVKKRVDNSPLSSKGSL